MFWATTAPPGTTLSPREICLLIRPLVTENLLAAMAMGQPIEQ